MAAAEPRQIRQVVVHLGIGRAQLGGAREILAALLVLAGAPRQVAQGLGSLGSVGEPGCEVLVSLLRQVSLVPHPGCELAERQTDFQLGGDAQDGFEVGLLELDVE